MRVAAGTFAVSALVDATRPGASYTSKTVLRRCRIDAVELLPFEEARAHARSLLLKSHQDWRTDEVRLNLPSRIPHRPDIRYPEFIDWNDWLHCVGPVRGGAEQSSARMDLSLLHQKTGGGPGHYRAVDLCAEHQQHGSCGEVCQTSLLQRHVLGKRGFALRQLKTSVWSSLSYASHPHTMEASLNNLLVSPRRFDRRYSTVCRVQTRGCNVSSPRVQLTST
jgi:hypothetical protein